MMIQIKHGNKKVQYGSWLMIEQINEVLLNAIEHNIPNIKYPVEKYLDEVFDNIIKELDFLYGIDRGHTIKQEQIDLTYEMLYHADHGLMFEGKGRLTIYPIRIFIKKDE